MFEHLCIYVYINIVTFFWFVNHFKLNYVLPKPDLYLFFLNPAVYVKLETQKLVWNIKSYHKN